jgi:hypothetical protein
VRADLQHAIPYLVRQLSVRKVVPTLTSTSAEIYLSMASAKQLDDMRFILVSAGAVRPAGVCSRHYICVAPRSLSYKRGERGGEPSKSLRFDWGEVPISW